MQYQTKQTPLRDRRQTSDEIKRLIREYHGDLENIFVRVSGALVPVARLPFDRYYDFVRMLRYTRDTEPVEEVGRPSWIIDKCGNTGRGMDCKKKACMIGAYLHHHGIPFRLVGSSTRPDKQIHHIFPQAKLSGDEWINVDATYSNYRIGMTKTVTTKEIL